MNRVNDIQPPERLGYRVRAATFRSPPSPRIGSVPHPSLAMPDVRQRPVGLYDPSYEHDACGVAMVARLDGEPSHETVERAIVALENLEHRGAAGADPNTGDGAGILLQLPDEFLRGVIGERAAAAPARYGVGVCFLPAGRRAPRRARAAARAARSRPRASASSAGATSRSTRTTSASPPTASRRTSSSSSSPRRDELAADQDAFERKLYVIRRVAEIAAGPDLVDPELLAAARSSTRACSPRRSCSGYYPDLQDARTKTALALVHSRFSTNTFPSWELAHPYRMIAHNGEINTLRGNVNWMRARESQLASELFGDDLQKVLPVVRPGGSDSATFDNVLELLVLAGRSLPHAVMMMVPEAYEGRDDLPEHLRGFYAFHSCLMEPWDGPAAVAFTDGRVIGATLDRNGLRPGRWLETERRLGRARLGDRRDGRAGRERRAQGPPAARQALPRRPRAGPDRRRRRGQARGRRRSSPYGEWYERGRRPPRRPARARSRARRAPSRCAPRQLAFGYTQEDLRVLLAPMAAKGEEPIGSMGNDAALAVLSRPPAAAVRLLQAAVRAGHEPADRPDPRGDRDEPRAPASAPSATCSTRRPSTRTSSSMQTPILRDRELEKLRQVDSLDLPGRTRSTSPGRSTTGPDGHGRARSSASAREAAEALADGVNILILSDRGVGPSARAIPSLLAVAGRPPPPRARGHAPAGRPRARVRRAARGPPLRDADRLRRGGDQPVPDVRVARRARRPTAACPDVDDVETAEQRTSSRAIGKGLLKTISKMGISTIQSYNGAQIFEAVGLAPELIDRHFTGTASRIGGIGVDVLARETLERHARAYPRTRRRPAAGRRRLRVAPRRRAPHVEPGDDRAAAARGPPRRPAETYDEYAKLDQRGRGARARRCAGCCSFRDARRTRGRRSTRSSRRARSSSASSPARCRSARSRARRTRRSRSR